MAIQTRRVTGVEVSPDPRVSEELLGFSIDRPVVGGRCGLRSLECLGWVVGRHEKAEAVEVLVEGRVCRRMPLSLSRPDVASHFGALSVPESCGFSGVIDVAAPDAEIRVIFANRAPVLLAKIRIGAGVESAARGAWVLLYHRIDEAGEDPWGLAVTPAHFDEHLRVIESDFHAVPLSEIVRNRGEVPEGAVAITLDDGYANNLYEAKPLLERRGIPATAFLATGWLGGKEEPWWDELDRILFEGPVPLRGLSVEVDSFRFDWDSGPPTPESDGREGRARLYRLVWEKLQGVSDPIRRRVLSELRSRFGLDDAPRAGRRSLTDSEVVELAKGGLVEIGAHTVTHTKLSSLDRARQAAEIRESRSTLEYLLGRPVEGFSYPFGAPSDFDDNSVSVLRESGFAYACTTSGEPVRGGLDLFRLPRVQVGDWDGDEFARRLWEWSSVLA